MKSVAKAKSILKKTLAPLAVGKEALAAAAAAAKKSKDNFPNVGSAAATAPGKRRRWLRSVSGSTRNR